MKKEKAIFIDRDGTINKISKDREFTNKIEQVELIDYVKEGLLYLKEMGYLIVVITNQTGIGKGYYEEKDLHQVNNEIQRQLGFKFDGIYACILPPTPDNPCRKPKPTMILQAAEDLNIDIYKSYMVGDKSKDIETGKNSKCLGTCYIKSFYEIEEDINPDYIVENLLEFAKIVGKMNNKN